MKIIAISQQLSFNKHGVLQEVIDANWGRFLDEINITPLYLSVRYNFKKLQFNGVILTGGGNLYEISRKPEDKIRDDFEISLVKFCIGKNIPVFGVCRGMQLINHYFGGTFKKVENHVGCTHILSDNREVNSYHNFAIDKLGKGLEIIDTNREDGIIESIHHTSHKIFAQMSHPERCDSFSAYEIAFLKDFFDVE
jgi:putative glutamine amidotransferase